MSTLEFIKNHYEKIILAILLILFVLALIYQIQIITNISRITPESLAIPKKDGEYESINFKADLYNPSFMLNKDSKWLPRTKFNPQDQFVTDLCMPFEIARCPHCTAFIPRFYFRSDPHKCPLCGGSLPEPPPDPPEGADPGDDTDGDGISDAVCKKYGWNVNDPNNALRDTSGNGFTNLFKVQNPANDGKSCDLVDPKSHPPLCFRLYVAEIKRIVLGVKLKKLQERGESRSDWDIQIDIKKKRDWGTKFCKINDTIKIGRTDYKIIDCNRKQEEEYNKDTKSNELKDKSEVTIQAVNGDDKVVMVVDQPVYSPKETAFLRDVGDNDKRYVVEQDRVFQMGEPRIGIEKYKVLQIDSSRKVVQLKRESDNKIFEISSKKRFEFESLVENNNREGMPPEMAPGMPGNMTINPATGMPMAQPQPVTHSRRRR